MLCIVAEDAFFFSYGTSEESRIRPFSPMECCVCALGDPSGR
jgi:hypothetical protein